MDILSKSKSVQFKILLNHKYLAIISITLVIILDGWAWQSSETRQKIFMQLSVCSKKLQDKYYLSLHYGKWLSTSMQLIKKRVFEMLDIHRNIFEVFI